MESRQRNLLSIGYHGLIYQWLTWALMLTVGLAEAAFIDQFSGARALGMSGAISAVANRADGVM
ncbi:MAG: hypothetical protein QGG39_02095, partial [Candidatus Poribacteria bacterium]|nr:hypothetical protein [Candidatus Poribacteria bacterium]